MKAMQKIVKRPDNILIGWGAVAGCQGDGVDFCGREENLG